MPGGLVTDSLLRATAIGPRELRVEIFGFDVSETSQIRRIRTVRDLGHEVHSFTMRRRNMNLSFEPEWPNTHLYEVANERLLRRAATVAASALRSGAQRARLRRADLILARNLDMLAIAIAARRIAGASHVPVIYECLDINGVLCRDDAIGAAMRWAERRLLRRVAMLVVSSPGFIREYFEPVQRYRGPWALWENKLAAAGPLPRRPEGRPRGRTGGPVSLGWVGTLRCKPSLDILTETARRMGDGVEIHAAGIVHDHALPDFHARIAALPNVHYHGPYRYPDDLADVYGGCDLSWAQDLWQAGSNSDWLLPNRIYEASWAGCPSIAVAGTETGRRVADARLGWVLGHARAEELERLLRGLDRAAIGAASDDLLVRPEREFVQSPQDIAEVLDAVAVRP